MQGDTNNEVIYVYEKGRLGVTGCRHKKSRKELKCQTDEFGTLIKSSIPLSNVNGDTNNVKSLFKQCVHFIAQHLSLLDSLVDFPEVIGQYLFDEAVDIGVLKSTNINTPKLLRKFTEAYEHLVMSSLSLQDDSMLVNCMTDALCTFKHVTKLNLSHCKLGNDHEMLPYISELESLETLVLRDNSLADQGIRRLTTPLRVRQKGPKLLYYLDLSENLKVTKVCSRYLKSFRHLKVLNMSSSGIEATAVNHVCETLGMKRIEDIKTMETEFQFKTAGWADELIASWRRETSKKTEKVEEFNGKDQLNSCVSFYRKKPLKPIITPNMWNHSPLVLVSCGMAEHSSSDNDRHTGADSVKPVTKCSICMDSALKRTCVKCARNRSKTHTKSSASSLQSTICRVNNDRSNLDKSADDSVENNDLLLSYMTCPKDTKYNQKGSLFTLLDT